jgi:hypothetical protein
MTVSTTVNTSTYTKKCATLDPAYSSVNPGKPTSTYKVLPSTNILNKLFGDLYYYPKKFPDPEEF